MYSATITIPDLEAAKRFVNISNKYLDYAMNLKSENYIIDAHSIIGVISLDMSKPIILEVDDNIPQEFYKEVAPFIG